MSKKYITVEGTKVMLTHFMPFDPVNGLGKSEVELLKTGYLIDEVPEPTQFERKVAEAHYTPEKGYYYEYIDVPNQQDTTLLESVKSGIITPEQFQQITGVNYSDI